MKFSTTVSFILKLCKPFKRYIVGLLFVGLTWAVALNVQPYIIKCILNAVNNPHPIHSASKTIGSLMCIYLACACIFECIFRWHDWLLIQFFPELRKHVGMQFVEQLTKHGNIFYQNNFSGSLSNKVNDAMTHVLEIIIISTDRIFNCMCTLILTLYTLWFVNPIFTCIFGFWLLIFFGVSLIMALKQQTLIQSAAEGRSTVTGHIVDMITNMPSIRIFGGYSFEQAYMRNSLECFANKERARDRAFLKINSFQSICFWGFQVTCFTYLFKGISAHTLPAGDFILVLSLNLMIIGQFWNLSADVRNLWEKINVVGQALQIIQSPIEIQDAPHAISTVMNSGSIQFDRVTFGYQQTTPIFNKLSVTIQSGERVGLVGYSGSGKSTFVNLVLRLYEVTSGSILMDAQPIGSITQDSLRGAISMIPQDPSLFHRTLMDNIRYGRLEATDQEVIEAAKKAYAHEFISMMPEGYQTLAGERGVKLSGGQRQRIAIARAILKKAPVLILDEATSQLDSVTECLIQASMEQLMKDKTTLVIAHRLSTLLSMDRILVFDKGIIVEDGTHQTLYELKGLYHKLWNTQFQGIIS